MLEDFLTVTESLSREQKFFLIPFGRFTIHLQVSLDGGKVTLFNRILAMLLVSYQLLVVVVELQSGT